MEIVSIESQVEEGHNMTNAPCKRLSLAGPVDGRSARIFYKGRVQCSHAATTAIPNQVDMYHEKKTEQFEKEPSSSHLDIVLRLELLAKLLFMLEGNMAMLS